MPTLAKNGKLYYSNRERFKYNAKRMKKGSIDKEGKPLSDFIRGVAAGKNAEMKRSSRIYKRKMKS